VARGATESRRCASRPITMAAMAKTATTATARMRTAAMVTAAER
jgi:hypothetical protein